MKLLAISLMNHPVQDGYDLANPINQQAYWLVKYLQQKHDVTLVCPDASATIFKDIISAHFNHEQSAFNEYKDQVKWGEYDLIIDFSAEKWSHEIAKEKKLKTLYIMHHLIHSYETPPPLTNPCLVGVSDAYSMLISARLGMPVRTLPFGYELPEKSDSVPKREDKGYFLYCGRIVKDKGVHELLSMCKRYRKELIICGDDRNVEQEYVFRLLQHCDGDKIKYYGAVGEGIKLKLIAEAHALVIPYLSDWDAMCCSTAKAATVLKVPTLTLNKGAVSEFIVSGNNGLIVNTLEQLDEAIKSDVVSERQCTFDAAHNSLPAYSKLDFLIEEAIKSPW